MDTLIIIPALNEEQSIVRTIDDIRRNGFHEIVVLNDGSSDETARVAELSGAKVLSLPFHIGIGGAVSLGLLYAQKKGYDAVVRVDADGQHDARYIQAILQPVMNDRADLCVGSRFLKPLEEGDRSSFPRRIGIVFFARLISFLTREHITDPTSGFNVFGRNAIRLFSHDYPSDYPEPEAIVIAKRAGLRIREVPVRMNKRTAGMSSIRYLKTLYYMLNVSLAIMLNYLRPAKKVMGNE